MGHQLLSALQSCYTRFVTYQMKEPPTTDARIDVYVGSEHVGEFTKYEAVV